MRKKIVALFTSMCILSANCTPANAMLSEAASIAINAVDGMLQEDDKKLESDILNIISNENEKEKLKTYIEKTRPLIKEKASFFNSTISPVFVWITYQSPALGNMLISTVLSAYIWKYKNELEDDNDTEAIKKFAELREHNIDAGQGIFEKHIELFVAPVDKDKSDLGLITDAGLMAMNAKQFYDRYESSAAAIAIVLEAVGVPMEQCDLADICSTKFTDNKSKNEKNISNDVNKSNTLVKENTNTNANANDNANVSTSPKVVPDWHWIKDSNNGAYIWNPEPSDGESIVWSGDYIQDGDYRFANGKGTVTWYKNGKIIQVDKGEFIHGRHHGRFSHEFPSGKVIYSDWDHGKEL